MEKCRSKELGKTSVFAEHLSITFPNAAHVTVASQILSRIPV
jgi:hypothetical protein